MANGIPLTFISKPMASETKTEAARNCALFPSRRVVMMRRAILTLAALMALSQTAMAGVPLFGHVSCSLVRFYVAKYSEAAAEKWARSHGASEAEIETARHCLHRSTDVQTASWAPKSQVVAPVAEHEGTQLKPDERDPGQISLQIPVEGQRTDPEQDHHDEGPAIRGVIRPTDIEDHSTERVSYETKNDLVPSNGKTSPLPRANAGGMHGAYNAGATRPAAWLKRLWDHLTRRPQFRVASLHLRGGRR
jgi:hypothetical protein